MLEWIIQFSGRWSCIYQSDDQSSRSGGPLLSTREDHMHQWIIYKVHTSLGSSTCVCPYIVPEEYSKCRSSEVQHNKDSSNNKQTILQRLPCDMFPSQYHAMWMPFLVFNMIISLRFLAWCCIPTAEYEYKCNCKLKLFTFPSGVMQGDILSAERSLLHQALALHPLCWSALSSDQIFSAPH